MAKPSAQRKSAVDYVKPILPPPPWAGPPLPNFLRVKWPWYRG